MRIRAARAAEAFLFVASRKTGTVPVFVASRTPGPRRPSAPGGLGPDAHVLELLGRGEAVEPIAQLVQVSDETQLWADTYERDVADVFAVQADVAESVAGALAVELLSDQQARAAAAKTPTVNPAAHDAYLRGRYHWNQRTEGGVRKAIEFFEQAIEHDPEYALAYTGLADCYIVLAQYGVSSAREVLPAARRAALRALEIDDELAQQTAHWRLERLAAVDRNILRLAMFELLFHQDTPHAVVIDEAIEIAKKYGAEESARFVNGVLDGFVKRRARVG